MRKLTTIIAVLLTWSSPAQADERTTAEPHVLLAQQCAAEISITKRVDECRLMWHIQLEKTGGDAAKMESVIRQYNTLFKKRSSKRRWVMNLSILGYKPDGWRDAVDGPWLSRLEDWWLRMVDAADQFLRNPGRHPCPLANQYGGRCDDDKHACDEVPDCWERQWCGEEHDHYAQAYWHRPSGGCARAISADLAKGR